MVINLLLLLLKNEFDIPIDLKKTHENHNTRRIVEGN